MAGSIIFLEFWSRWLMRTNWRAKCLGFSRMLQFGREFTLFWLLVRNFFCQPGEWSRTPQRYKIQRKKRKNGRDRRSEPDREMWRAVLFLCCQIQFKYRRLGVTIKERELKEVKQTWKKADRLVVLDIAWLDEAKSNNEKKEKTSQKTKRSVFERWYLSLRILGEPPRRSQIRVLGLLSPPLSSLRISPVNLDPATST